MSIMCAAIHAATNGLIEYFVYTTFMYTWPLPCNMANTNEAQYPEPIDDFRIDEWLGKLHAWIQAQPKRQRTVQFCLSVQEEE